MKHTINLLMFTKSQHLIHNWCDLMGLEYKEQQPQIIINYAQQQLVSHWKRDRPTMVLQTNGVLIKVKNIL